MKHKYKYFFSFSITDIDTKEMKIANKVLGLSRKIEVEEDIPLVEKHIKESVEEGYPETSRREVAIFLINWKELLNDS